MGRVSRFDGEHAGRQPVEDGAAGLGAYPGGVGDSPFAGIVEGFRSVHPQNRARKHDPARDNARMTGNWRAAGPVQRMQEGAFGSERHAGVVVQDARDPGARQMVVRAHADGDARREISASRTSSRGR